MKRPIRIGITGKLGSGKSTLLDIMQRRGIPVIRSDDVAKKVMEGDPKLRGAITGILGPDCYNHGIINRSYIASKIFSDRALREQVEAVVHPATTAEIERMVESDPS